mmetsp:Transcript_110024/g.354872  ORF Transcript_110024/g.354872 Transcript_110024/m.354872 type:complete len:656 (-) Transcript_110024:242-2209(-)
MARRTAKLDRTSVSMALGAVALGITVAQGGFAFAAAPCSSSGRPTAWHTRWSLQGSSTISARPGPTPKASASAASSAAATVSFALAAAAACSRRGSSGGESSSTVLRPSAAPGRRVAAPVRATATAEARPTVAMPSGIRLSGVSLAAALEMQCAAAGADYAIYWVNVDGQLVVGSHYMKPAAQDKCAAYVKATESFQVPSDGCSGPLSTVYHLGQAICIQDAGSYTHVKRKDLAAESGVQSICFAPCGGGVFEYGVTTNAWMETLPSCPVMPKDEIRKAFEDLGASYAMFWALQDEQFSVVADYTSESWAKDLRASRGDDKTFCSESRRLKIDAGGSEPVAETANLGIEIRVTVAESLTLQRKALAAEFGLKALHLMPVEGGVLECGISDQKLTGLTLQAALKMRCDSAGSCYAMYWTETDGMFRVAGAYVTPERRKALRAKGLTTDFADASKYLTISAESDALVSTCARHGTPTFVADAAATETFCRQALAGEYGIESIVCKPVKGGVLEFGTSSGPETATWRDMPPCPDLPKDEMKKALEDLGAAYLVFWQLHGDHYEVTAEFATPDHERAIRDRYGEDDTFASVSRMFALPADGDGYVATAARSGKSFILPNAMEEASLKRQKLAQKFGIREVYIVPGKDGVLEYGMATEIT